ncbi:MAG: hypothetical protein KF819_08355 [Labilithrix sp.]|nr:hypothetical protein [Labilithrix sp.]
MARFAVNRLGALAMREAYRREVIPERGLWWLAAAGMRDWYRVLGKRLAPHFVDDLEGTRALLSRLSVRMFERRWDALSRTLPRRLPDRADDPRAVALLMSALYRAEIDPKAAWIFAALGGPPITIGERLRARTLRAKLGVRARWEEVATHLGELLVVLTEDLPAHLPHARKILGEVCFDAGARYAARVKSAFGFPDVPDDPPKAAMEILRMSEYVFRVNPEHWSESDGRSGWLEGTACPWYTRPGWNGAHCGIFGQFQSGIASVFGLRYHLSKTIPKHGGQTCRIDVKPITLRRKEAST